MSRRPSDSKSDKPERAGEKMRGSEGVRVCGGRVIVLKVGRAYRRLVDRGSPVKTTLSKIKTQSDSTTKLIAMMRRRNNAEGGTGDSSPDADHHHQSTDVDCCSPDGMAAKNKDPAAMSRLQRQSSTLTAMTSTSNSTGTRSRSRATFYSAQGGNVWSKLLAKDDIWDGLLKGTDAYDDDDDSLSGFDRLEGLNIRQRAGRCVTAWGYETKHFFKTLANNPRIIVASLLCCVGVMALGLTYVNSERSAYIEKGKATATFVAEETADWFANEFRRTMVPLYAVQQGVVHRLVQINLLFT